MKKLRKSTSQRDQKSRVLFKFEYEGDDGEVRSILVREVRWWWTNDDGKPMMMLVVTWTMVEMTLETSWMDGHVHHGNGYGNDGGYGHGNSDDGQQDDDV